MAFCYTVHVYTYYTGTSKYLLMALLTNTHLIAPRQERIMVRITKYMLLTKRKDQILAWIKRYWSFM